MSLLIGRKTVHETNIFHELPNQLTFSNIVEKAATEPIVKKATIYSLLASLVLKSGRASRSSIPDDDEIEEHAASTFAPCSQEMSQTQPDDPLSLIHKSSDPELQRMIRNLCVEFVDILLNITALFHLNLLLFLHLI